MRRFWPRIAALGLLLLALSSPIAVLAETVYLKDGSTLVGTITSADNDGIQFTTSFGVLAIKKERIASIDYRSAAPGLDSSSQPVTLPGIESPLDIPPAPLNRPSQMDEKPTLNPGAGEMPPAFSVNQHHAVLSFELGEAISNTTMDLTNVGGGKGPALGNGPFYAFQLLDQLDPAVSLGFEISEIDNGNATSSTLIPHANVTTSGGTTSVMALLKIIPFQMKAPLYLLGGVGFQAGTLQLSAAPQPGYYWGDTRTTESRNFVNSNASGEAYALGAGIEGHITSSLLIGLEYRYQIAKGGSFPTTSYATAGGFNSLSQSSADSVIAGRLAWTF